MMSCSTNISHKLSVLKAVEILKEYYITNSVIVPGCVCVVVSVGVVTHDSDRIGKFVGVNASLATLIVLTLLDALVSSVVLSLMTLLAL